MPCRRLASGGAPYSPHPRPSCASSPPDSPRDRYELQEVQAALKRSDAALNLTFLKNVLVRYMKEGDLDNSLPAIAQALQFSPEEVQEIRESRRGSLMGEVGRTFHLW